MSTPTKFLSKLGVGVFVVLTVWPAIAPPSASAQGLFGRMRARIQSRRAPVPQPNPATQPVQPNRYRAAPSNGNRNQNSPRILATPDARQMNRPSLGVDSPTLGIEISPAQAGPHRGLAVLGFSPESKASQAGLRRGDIIVSIAGVRTSSMSDVATAQSRTRNGQQADIQLFRNGILYRAKVPVIGGQSNVRDPEDSIAKKESGENSDSLRTGENDSLRKVAKPPVSSNAGPTLARSRASLGLEVRNASPQRGVEVATTAEGTAGTLAGFKTNDRIVSVKGRLISDVNDLVRELAISQPGDEIRFGVVRGDSMLEMDVEMGGPGGKPVRSAQEALSNKTQKASEPVGGNSLLSGVGSALGSLFGGSNEEPKTTQNDTAPATDQLNTRDKSDKSILPDPLALPEDTLGDDFEFGNNELPPPLAE